LGLASAYAVDGVKPVFQAGLKHPWAFCIHPKGMRITQEEPKFDTISPKILYFGNPVALISSVNEDGTPNLAPISSFWALGWTMTLGLLNETKTLKNLEMRPECVVNLPSPDLWRQVEALAPLTGQNPVPGDKSDKFRFEKDKFAAGSFTPVPSEMVSVPRVKECPVQLEAITRSIHALVGEPRVHKLGGATSVEVEILRVHVRREFIMDEHYVDPAKWQPLIYNFRHYFGLGEELGSTFRAEV
jgi:flavin reductase (DIM6/NTAB) family NADH-FMN oxidoreductase RutF